MLNPGETTEVKGSAAKPYTVKNVDGIIWSCTCPAWKNSGGSVDKKSCKHIRKVHGDAAEAARIGGVPSSRATVVAAVVAKPNGQAQAHGGQHNGRQITADATYAQSVLDRAAAEGRELRQDEKAKLHGPPVLLAHSFDDQEDLDPTGYWQSEKLDGVRAYWNGVEFISRQGNLFHAPDWFRMGLPTHPLDGELWIARKMFQKTISVVKRLEWGDGANLVKYVVYDMPHLTCGFEERMEALEQVCLSSNSKILKFHPQTLCKGRMQLKQDLDAIEALGAEGLMLRKPGSLYEAQRSNTLLKVKPFKDTEALVIGHKPGKGRHKGTMGALVLRMPSGVEFDLGTGFSDAERRNPPTIGSTVSYRYTELTNDGKPKCTGFLCLRDYE